MATNQRQATAIVKEILDNGLADSTWRDLYPDAYDDLLNYRADLEGSALKALTKETL